MSQTDVAHPAVGPGRRVPLGPRERHRRPRRRRRARARLPRRARRSSAPSRSTRTAASFRRLAAVVDGDARPLRPGERLALPPLWLAAGTDGWTLLEEWAAACGRAMRARVPARTPIGWCSWYYYFTRVRETDVVDNLEALRRLRGRVRCDYVQVDDGYQRAIGDWLEPNEKFPHGMRWLAQRIRAAGFDAGIWLAPFLARPESQLDAGDARTGSCAPSAAACARACWNPMWSLGRPAYALDTTHPDVLDWLRELARTIVAAVGLPHPQARLPLRRGAARRARRPRR